MARMWLRYVALLTVVTAAASLPANTGQVEADPGILAPHDVQLGNDDTRDYLGDEGAGILDDHPIGLPGTGVRDSTLRDEGLGLTKPTYSEHEIKFEPDGKGSHQKIVHELGEDTTPFMLQQSNKYETINTDPQAAYWHYDQYRWSDLHHPDGSWWKASKDISQFPPVGLKEDFKEWQKENGGHDSASYASHPQWIADAHRYLEEKKQPDAPVGSKDYNDWKAWKTDHDTHAKNQYMTRPDAVDEKEKRDLSTPENRDHMLKGVVDGAESGSYLGKAQQQNYDLHQGKKGWNPVNSDDWDEEHSDECTCEGDDKDWTWTQDSGWHHDILPPKSTCCQNLYKIAPKLGTDRYGCEDGECQGHEWNTPWSSGALSHATASHTKPCTSSTTQPSTTTHHGCGNVYEGHCPSPTLQTYHGCEGDCPPSTHTTHHGCGHPHTKPCPPRTTYTFSNDYPYHESSSSASHSKSHTLLSSSTQQPHSTMHSKASSVKPSSSHVSQPVVVLSSHSKSKTHKSYQPSSTQGGMEHSSSTHHGSMHSASMSGETHHSTGHVSHHSRISSFKHSMTHSVIPCATDHHEPSFKHSKPQSTAHYSSSTMHRKPQSTGHHYSSLMHSIASSTGHHLVSSTHSKAYSTGHHKHHSEPQSTAPKSAKHKPSKSTMAGSIKSHAGSESKHKWSTYMHHSRSSTVPTVVTTIVTATTTYCPETEYSDAGTYVEPDDIVVQMATQTVYANMLNARQAASATSTIASSKTTSSAAASSAGAVMYTGNGQVIGTSWALPLTAAVGMLLLLCVS